MSRYVDAEIIVEIIRLLPKEIPHISPTTAAAFELAAVAVEKYAETAQFEAQSFAAQMWKASIPEEGADYENSHAKMDGLMVKKLRELGFGEAMDIFDDAPKWYA